jgi:hypothetical protein
MTTLLGSKHVGVIKEDLFSGLPVAFTTADAGVHINV